MKAVLKFNLPEEQDWFKAASKSLDMSSDIHGLREELRSMKKHREFKTAGEALEAAWEAFHEYLGEYIDS